MRERINRLAKGILDTDLPKIQVSPEKCESPVRAGEISRTEITVSSANGVHLKGLVYSDTPRVHVMTPSFGGQRNRILLEIDSRYLESGEEIRGTLNLITNGGECRIPFCFLVISGSAGKTISSIRTTEEFASIAKADREAALRLFEYRDFTDAPFLQNMKTRALYNAFSGRPDKAGEMEEFLIAAGGKEPAKIRIEENDFAFPLVTAPVHGSVSLTIENPGWFCLTAGTDGDFIRIQKKSVTDADFKDGHFDFPFSIDPQKLHPGENSGSILFSSESVKCSVQISAVGGDAVRGNLERENNRNLKKHFGVYAECRVRYTCLKNTGADAEGLKILTDRMKGELNTAIAEGATGHYLVLLRAEAELLSGNTDQCTEILNSVQAGVLTERQKEVREFCLQEYLYASLPGAEDKKEAVLRLLKNMMTERHVHSIFPLLISLDGSLSANPAAMMETIRMEYVSGNRSPFLYAEYCRQISLHPELLDKLGSLELHALWFGARRNLISSEAAYAIAHHAGSIHTWNRLYFPLLKKLYEKYPTDILLTAVCMVLIREDNRSEAVHEWFERGLERKVRLTGLYEYYLYTLPESYDRCLPAEVLQYFVYDNLLDDRARTRLYENVILYLIPEKQIWRKYKDQIEAFTLKQAAEGKTDPHLTLLYKKILRPDNISAELAAVLPKILESREVTCTSPYIRSVVVVYPELEDVGVYQLDRGKACVPVFSEDAVFLFQNAYGNRFYNIPHEEKKICDMPELLDRCGELCPDSLPLRLKYLKQIILQRKCSAEEQKEIESSAGKLPLSDLFRKKLLSVMISSALPEENAGGSAEEAKTDFLIRSDKDMLTEAERIQACNILIHMGRFREAYEMIRKYGCEAVDPENLQKLCTKMILEKLFTEDRLLLHLADKVFSLGKNENVITDYLCEHYNGTTGEMLRILTAAIGERTETYDMEERLLAQMIFTGSRDNMDQVFRWYINRKKPSENLIRAYITVKCADYFLKDAALESDFTDIFEYLEKTFFGSFDRENVPVIYQLALTKYYSTLTALSPERTKLASEIMNCLLDKKYVFSYFRNLAKFVTVPSDILDRSIVEYRSENGAKAEMRMRILPGETEYHTEEMKCMYCNIFVKQKVLFSGETWEYDIYEKAGEKRIPKKHGSIRNPEKKTAGSGSRFDCLDDLTVKLREGDEKALKPEMEQFIMQEETAARLFGLM